MFRKLETQTGSRILSTHMWEYNIGGLQFMELNSQSKGAQWLGIWKQ